MQATRFKQVFAAMFNKGLAAWGKTVLEMVLTVKQEAQSFPRPYGALPLPQPGFEGYNN